MRVTGLSKAYGGRVVLDVGWVELARGEILAVMGPSGSGKTTLLRLLATLERPTTGEVRFGELVWKGDLSPTGLLAWRRRLALVSQSPVLFTGTVADNVALGLQLRGRNGTEVTERVSEALDRVGLLPLARARADSLSAGEAQRVALARALVIRPEVLLLDEATGNLDPANVAVIERTLIEAVADWSPAVLLVTHNLFQARRVAHRTALLVAGKVVETGETRQVFERPADPRTAAFVKGEMVF